MAKKFPKNLYVKIMKDGSSDYFTADEMLWVLVEMGQKAKVATYKLEAVQDVEGVAEIGKARRMHSR